MNNASHCEGTRRIVARLLILGALLVAEPILIPPSAQAEDITATKTKQNATTKTVTTTTTTSGGDLKEKKIEATDLKTNATTTSTTTYTADPYNNKAKNTTIVKKDEKGNVTSTEYQVWGADGKQTDGWIQWPQKGKKKYIYDPKKNVYIDDPNKVTPTKKEELPTYASSQRGFDPSDIRSDPSYSDAIRSPDNPNRDGSNFFNTGSASHELKFGAGYRGAQVDDSQGHYPRGWFHELRVPPQESVVIPRDRMFANFNYFDISISGVGFFGDGDRTVTTTETHEVERTFFTTEERTFTHYVFFDNGFTKGYRPEPVTKDVRVPHTVTDKVKVEKHHEEGNFNNSAGGINLEVGYSRGDFRVGVAALLMDGNDVFGGVSANFYWLLSSLACNYECCGRDRRIVPYLVGGPGFFFGEQSVATGHIGVGVNVDISDDILGFAEFQEHWGSYDEHWGAVHLGVRIPMRERAQIGYHPGVRVYNPPPPPPPPP